MIREMRCCMCPNRGNPDKRICPAGGPMKPVVTVCDFVLSYYDDTGALVFVAPGRATDGKTWMTLREKTRGGGMRRVLAKALPIRATRDEAQEDLNAYAKRKGWTVCDG